MPTRLNTAGLVVLLFLAHQALLTNVQAQNADSAVRLAPEEARTIAKEAYIYGFPLVDNYRIQYSYFVNRDGAEFKAPWNQLHNEARVYTPA